MNRQDDLLGRLVHDHVVDRYVRSFDTQKRSDLDIEIVEDRAAFESLRAAKLIVGLIGQRVRQVKGMNQPGFGVANKERVASVECKRAGRGY